jgi:hypothetical protein
VLVLHIAGYNDDQINDGQDDQAGKCIDVQHKLHNAQDRRFQSFL